MVDIKTGKASQMSRPTQVDSDANRFLRDTCFSVGVR